MTSISEITKALRSQDIEYRVEHAGTENASVYITHGDGYVIAGPGLDEQGNMADGIDWCTEGADGEVGTTDWAANVEDFLADLRTVQAWITK